MKLSTKALIGFIAPVIGAAAGTYGCLVTKSNTIAFLEGILVSVNVAFVVVNFRYYLTFKKIERLEQ